MASHGFQDHVDQTAIFTQSPSLLVKGREDPLVAQPLNHLKAPFDWLRSTSLLAYPWPSTPSMTPSKHPPKRAYTHKTAWKLAAVIRRLSTKMWVSRTTRGCQIDAHCSPVLKCKSTLFIGLSVPGMPSTCGHLRCRTLAICHTRVPMVHLCSRNRYVVTVPGRFVVSMILL